MITAGLMFEGCELPLETEEILHFGGTYALHGNL